MQLNAAAGNKVNLVELELLFSTCDPVALRCTTAESEYILK